MLTRTLVISQGAFAALCECRRGDVPLEHTRNADGSISVQIASTSYDSLVEQYRKLNARDLSDAILIMYRQAGGVV